MGPQVSGITGRTFADFLLFGVTAGELALLFRLTPTFGIADWIYLLQHVLVLGIAVTRRAPTTHDSSPGTAAAVIVAYTYPYAQVVYLKWDPGAILWSDGGLVLVTIAALLSLASLVSLGRWFGVRPALRGLATSGPYRLVRHPMYLAYLIADIGYNLQGWNPGTVLLVAAGWASLAYRIQAEERIVSHHADWPAFAARTRYRLLPGLW